eukprot:10386114-Karenia_brevis.AAC.1
MRPVQLNDHGNNSEDIFSDEDLDPCEYELDDLLKTHVGASNEIHGADGEVEKCSQRNVDDTSSMKAMILVDNIWKKQRQENVYMQTVSGATREGEQRMNDERLKKIQQAM